MLRTDFDYQLPQELIAQEPLERRDESRLLVLDRTRKAWHDSSFAELPSLLAKGDLLILNNTRVFPARLAGHRILAGRRGAAVEALLLARTSERENEWEVLARPGRALRPGAELEFGAGRLRGVVTAVLDHGRRRIRFDPGARDFDHLVDEIGNTPLPPYIKRHHHHGQQGQPGQEGQLGRRIDELRYQTVYASERGAIAAPTAGLHFTPRLLNELRARGVETVELTHHVGYATFQPLRAERVEEHRIAAERYQIKPEAAAKIRQVRASGGRLLAVGTTTVRALESAALQTGGEVAPGPGVTDLFIYPGHKFRAVDMLLTNFHLPQSSLLLLVAAFAGREFTLAAYRHAVEARYRFYSYGDCMLIL